MMAQAKAKRAGPEIRECLLCGCGPRKNRDEKCKETLRFAGKFLHFFEIVFANQGRKQRQKFMSRKSTGLRMRVPRTFL